MGVTGAEPFTEALETLRRHKASGLSGPLHFTYDDPETASNARASFPWAKSLVVVGVEYASRAPAPAKTGPVVGRFATTDHYEAVRRVTAAIAEAFTSAGTRAEVVIDDNRLLDRAGAAQAGVGWIGKSTMVLTPRHGPWMLLGTVVTEAELDPTEPMSRGCGTCRSCIPACPTTAITPTGLDARRCLSTWLQTSGFIPLWVRPKLGRRIYGCDDCLTSCPPGSRVIAKSPQMTLSFSELLALGDDALVERFSWWFIPHREGRYLRRNLLVAAGNSAEPEALAPIEQHLAHRSSMIRSHAGWALARHNPSWAADRLRDALRVERAPEARLELAVAVTMATTSDDYDALRRLDEAVRTT